MGKLSLKYALRLLNTVGTSPKILTGLAVHDCLFPMKSFHKPVLAVGLALAASASIPALGAINDAPSNETIVLEKITVEGKRDRLQVFDRKTEDLFDKTRLTKTICYRDVILASYDTSKIDVLKALLLKKHYRETVAKGHDFLCNYAAINQPVPVIYSHADPLRGSTGGFGGIGIGSETGTEFLFKRKIIRIDNAGSEIKVAHAAGASLSASPSPEAMEKVKRLGAARKDREFVDEVNFEIRLQDINRFYALITNRPLLNSLDALQSLVLLGEKPEPRIVKAIFERNGLSFSQADIEGVYKTTLQGRTGQFGSEGLASSGGKYADFTLARRLVCGFQVIEKVSSGEIGSTGAQANTDSMYSDFVTALEPGLETMSGKQYEAYLERILIEAPGHI